MRDEDEIGEMADRAAVLVRLAAEPAKTDYLRGVEAALDWVVDETMPSPLEDLPL